MPTTPLRFAVPPTLGPETTGRVAQLSTCLTKAMGRPVEVSTPTSYELLAKELLSGKVDAAWVPPFVCARIEAMGVRVMVRGVRDGVSTYRAALVGLKDRALSIDKLLGHTAVWSDRDSVAGYLLPIAMLREHGVDPRRTFAKQEFAGSYRAALEAVAAGQGDVTSVFAPPQRAGLEGRTGLEELWPERRDDFQVLALSAESPNDGIAGSLSTSPQLLSQLEQVLLGLSADATGRDVLHDVFRCERFEVAPRLGYRALYRVALASL